MIERIKRWWRGPPPGEDDDNDNDANGDGSEIEMGPSVPAQPTNADLIETRQLIRESRAKLKIADSQIADYQRRIRAENARRLAMTRGDRSKGE